MKRHLLAAMLLLQCAAVVAGPGKGPVRGGKPGMGQGMRGQHGQYRQRIESFDKAINSHNFEAFNKELAGYHGPKMGLYALIGKITLAIDANHASGAEQGVMAKNTHQLNEMKTAVVAKLKTTPDRAARKAGGPRKKAAAGTKRPGAAKRAPRVNGAKKAVATKAAAVESADEAGE